MSDDRSLANPKQTTKLGGDDRHEAWTVLADQLGGFCAAWERDGEPPKLAQFAPPEPAGFRRLTLIELVKIDLEQRWQRHHDPISIEDYVQRYPELREEDGSVPCDLVYEEYHVRRRAGDDVTPEEFFRRFVGEADRLRRLFGADDPATSTRLFQGTTSQPPEVGESIDDFDLLTQLGKGAFGTVFLARQRSMQRLVALKVTASRSEEAPTLAQLDHPHIVRVYDQRAIADRGLNLLYMQYVAGCSLHDVIAELRQHPRDEWNGKLLLNIVDDHIADSGIATELDVSTRTRLLQSTWAEVVCLLGLQIASALDCAHQRGVLHRDLKPANILLDNRGAAKLVDFNISFCSKLDGANPAAYFGGSLAYMSPEQLESCNPHHERAPDTLDGRSDIYAMAIVLWELSCGLRPFQDEVYGSNWPGTLQQAVRCRGELLDTRPLRRVSDEVEGLADVIKRALQPNVDDRPSSASDVALQLRLCLEPQTRRIVQPREQSWHAILQRGSLALLLILVLLPNAIAGVFNYYYNEAEIVRPLQDAQGAFWKIQLIINGIAFPAGLAIGVVVAWPVAQAMRKKSRRPSGDRTVGLRSRCLSLGHWGALLGVTEWLIAGVIYPIAIHLSGITLSPTQYFHFFVSLALCGTIAATYPFFFVTWLCVRHFYPRLLGSDAPAADEAARLRWLHRTTSLYLALGAALPLLGMTLLVLIGNEQNRVALAILSGSGFVGFLAIFVLSRSLQNNLQHLTDYLQIVRNPAVFSQQNLLAS